MIIYNGLSKKKFKEKKCAIAIGNFDGLHLGHNKVLKKAQLEAKEKKLKFGVVTFEPVPVMFFNKKIKYHRINNYDQKISALKSLNLDFLLIIRFDRKFSNYKPINFIKKIIFQFLRSKLVFISENFRFGKNREGGISTLKENEKIFFYKTKVINPLKKNYKTLSSTLIRKEISKGNIKKVNKLLGRNWSIIGKVIKGDKRGRVIGFPTCNIELKNYVLPKLGVYGVNIKCGNIERKGIANFGSRPTFKGKNMLLEVNIFNLNANLYNKNIEVFFKNFIRPEKKFKNVDELKLQIKKDINKAKN